MESITARRSSNTRVKVRVSYLTASGYLWGSLSYTPSTIVALNMASAPISKARRADAVSVEKMGLPVPPPNTTILPASSSAIALSLRKVSATCGMAELVITTAGTPCWRRASLTAMAFITVASIPILSASMRSILPEERPRQKLPPPTTMPICAPRSYAALMPAQIEAMVASSKPVPFSPESASPETFKRIRLY